MKFTQEEFQALKDKRREDLYYFQIIHYNSYVEIYYRIPVSELKSLSSPYWANISSMEILDVDGVPTYEIQVGIYETGRDWDTRLKYEAISFNVDIIHRFEKPEFK